eukprot:COSAG01_NODE_29587_length_634_cov_0.962617_1_plen_35_part_01
MDVNIALSLTGWCGIIAIARPRTSLGHRQPVVPLQ